MYNCENNLCFMNTNKKCFIFGSGNFQEICQTRQDFIAAQENGSQAAQTNNSEAAALVQLWTVAAQNSSNSDAERAVYYQCAEELHQIDAKREEAKSAICKGMPHGSCKGEQMCETDRACFEPA